MRKKTQAIGAIKLKGISFDTLWNPGWPADAHFRVTSGVSVGYPGPTSAWTPPDGCDQSRVAEPPTDDRPPNLFPLHARAFLAISMSGRTPNVVAAAQVAREIGISLWASPPEAIATGSANMRVKLPVTYTRGEAALWRR